MITVKTENLIIRYLSEDIDRKGMLALLRWIAEDKENEDYFLEQCRIRQGTCTEGLEAFDAGQAWQKMRARIRARRRTRRVAGAVLAAAAAFACAFVVSKISYNSAYKTIESSFADIVVEAPQGSRTMITLPDGSGVWLNAGSRISYTQGFGVTERSVTLGGEAYFEVKKNEALPFSVKSGNLEVVVLGTKFNFRDYADDDTAEVSLTEGRVSLSSGAGNCGRHILAPGDRAVIDKCSGVVAIDAGAAEGASDWTDGTIVFENTSLKEIARTLERCFGIPVKVRDAQLGDIRFSGEFSMDRQSLHEVLEALSGTYRIKYRAEENGIEIY